jgi:putative addiction module killer protein
MNELKLIPFINSKGKEPFTDWIFGLDSLTRKRILVRLARIQAGNFGDCKCIGERLFELRLFFGKGYRIYFGKDVENIIILLGGGSKNTQVNDIAKAKSNWEYYCEQKNKKN